MEEKLIKSKERVEKYGEVFTPQHIVEQMLNQEGIKEMCENLTATFLEPTAGEGVFLVEILRRKLEMVADTYNKNIKQVSNYSLLALSTIYGIELLEDNLQTCVINLYEAYYEFYLDQCKQYEAKRDHKILDSAKTIIKVNLAQGDFLKRTKLKYIKSKFMRALLGIKKVTQDNKSKEIWSIVPLQDFTENSDIDWTKSIKEIDRQLYAKYDLNDDEINFIETNVQAMK